MDASGLSLKIHPKPAQLRRVERTLVEVEDPNPKVGLVGFQWSPFHPTRNQHGVKKIAREKGGLCDQRMEPQTSRMEGWMC